jgi:hypothetical protein
MSESLSNLNDQPVVSKPEKMADHDYYMSYNEKGHIVTDMDKMRDEAYRKQQGDYYADSESSVIHYHDYRDPCDKSDQSHSVYSKLVKNVEGNDD